MCRLLAEAQEDAQCVAQTGQRFIFGLGNFRLFGSGHRWRAAIEPNLKAGFKGSSQHTSTAQQQQLRVESLGTRPAALWFSRSHPPRRWIQRENGRREPPPDVGG